MMVLFLVKLSFALPSKLLLFSKLLPHFCRRHCRKQQQQQLHRHCHNPHPPPAPSQVGVVALILVRTVKSDYARFSSASAYSPAAAPAAAAAAAVHPWRRLSSMDEEDGMAGALVSDMHDDCGWKQVPHSTAQHSTAPLLNR